MDKTDHEKLHYYYLAHHAQMRRQGIDEFVLDEKKAKSLWEFYHGAATQRSAAWEACVRPHRETYWPFLLRQIVALTATAALNAFLKTHPEIAKVSLHYDDPTDVSQGVANFYDADDLCINDRLGREEIGKLGNLFSGRLGSHSAHWIGLQNEMAGSWKSHEASHEILASIYGPRGHKMLQEHRLELASHAPGRGARNDKV